MKIYIARGYNTWTASLDRDDALLRLIATVGELKGISLVSTTGDWEISQLDGCVSSDQEIVQETLNAGELHELASFLVGRLTRLLTSLQEATGHNYEPHVRALDKVEEKLDSVDYESEKWDIQLI